AKLILDFAVFSRWSNSLFSQLSLYTASTLSFQPASVGARGYPGICIQQKRLTIARTASNSRSSHRSSHRDTVYYECMRRSPRSGDG
ncbi:hypothetical protein B0H11DRAFT_2018396, partial [Mycena galericulata]